MKLRSNTVKEVANSRQPILQTNPATEKITASNLSSFLLQLPLELKTQIYTYLLGGEYIHVEPGNPYRLYPCCVEVTASLAQQPFDAESDANVDHENNNGRDASNPLWIDSHRRCYSRIKHKPSRCKQTARRNLKRGWTYFEPPKCIHFPINILRTCRQFYHEANHVIYSANTFSFQNPDLLSQFISHLDSIPSGPKTHALRHLHLHMTIYYKYGENSWNRALSTVGKHFTSLSSIDISIEQAIWTTIYNNVRKRRKNPSMFKNNTFLTSVAKLGELKLLREMTLMVTDIYPWIVVREDEKKFSWSNEQKQVWARDVMANVLGRAKDLR